MQPLSHATVAIACLLLLVSGVAAQHECVLDFDRVGEDWVPSPIDENSGELSRLDRPDGPHARALKVPGSTPKSFGVTCYPWQDWTGYTTLSFEIFFPPEMPPGADLQVYIKDRHYWWYQTFPLHRPDGTREPIRPGQWTSFSLDISEDSGIWEPGGHRKAWHRVLHLPRELGFRIFCDDRWAGWVLIDNVRLSGWEPPLGRFDPTRNPPLAEGLELDLSATQVPVYEKLEVTFDPGRVYENPFDPEVVDVQGRFRSPGGRELVIPGFFYQAYERSRTVEGWEKLIPVGEPCWKLRFSPTEEGTWRFVVSVRDALGELRSREHTFTATPPLDPRGMVRVSRRDPMYFEFDNGELFVPNGINMRDGGDQAEAQEGTYAFDRFFRRFHDEGLNFVRTWMCAWWAGIEWDEQYHSRFDGVGRYCMYNAWRLDYLFDLADRHDLFIELTLGSHGQLRRDKYDAEWRYNPYAAHNGGYLPSPSMFFTSEQVKADLRKRYRYIVARWGYSQHLMSYDLWNEIDLSEGRDAAEIAAWHAEMADYIKRIDPWQHLVCTHVCLYGSWGDALWDLPQIEYIQADAYWQDRQGWHKPLNGFFDSKAHYRNKPMLFIEYGPQTADVANHEAATGTPYPYAIWQREFRVVGWIGNMMPLAAAPVWWYHQQWDELKLYESQQAMVRFNEGLDPRGRGLRKIPALTSDPERLFAQAKCGTGIATFYVFDWPNMNYESPEAVPEPQRVRQAWVELTGVPPGAYRLEWWDPYAGAVREQAELIATAAPLRIELPPFAQDIAAKLIALEGQ
ncbi:MAG: DUF5060 domain-containing protein [Armatimonadota bacterium]